ncbi:MAG: SpoIIE family protein phosphatase [Christensenellales bacterium]|jgi:stage II sporulation protein E
MASEYLSIRAKEGENMQRAIERLLRGLKMPAVREVVFNAGIFAAFVLLARAKLPDSLAPFATAAAAAAWCAGLQLSAILGCFAGLASVASIDGALSLSVALAAAWAFKRYTGRTVKRQVMLAIALGELTALFALRMSSPYAAMMGGLSALAAILLFVVYHSAIRTLLTLKIRKILSEEEVISLCILCGTALLGLVDVAPFGISLSAVLGGCITLLLAYTGGAGAGAACGIALGVMLVLGGENGVLVSLGTMGVIAGGMKKLGRPGTAAGCLMAGAAISVYSRSDATTFAASVLSAALFLAVPNKVISDVGRFVNASLRRERSRQEYLFRLRELLKTRLTEFSSAFAEMGELFAKPLPKKKPASHAVNLRPLRPICKGCAAERRCWSDEARLTLELCSAMKGEPPFRLSRCPRLEGLCSALRALDEAKKREQAAEDRAERSALLSGKQLVGVASVVDTLAKRIVSEVRFDDRLETGVLARLSAALTPAEDVVAQRAGGRLTVTVSCTRCTNQCDSRMLRAVSEACGMKMRVAGKRCKDDGCVAVYEEARTLEIHAGIAKKSAGEISGDTAIATGLPDGRYLIALSDGMGTGKKAARESSDAVALLEKLLRAGVDLLSTLSAVNRLLALRSEGDMFTTLDCCLIDLVSGRCECAKQSAAPTVWISSNGVTLLSGDSLPLGILEEAPPERQSFILKEGDWLIFVSDGIYDTLGADLPSLAATCACGDPTGAAICLTEAAAKRDCKDDMTVIAARVVGGCELGG